MSIFSCNYSYIADSNMSGLSSGGDAPVSAHVTWNEIETQFQNTWNDVKRGIYDMKAELFNALRSDDPVSRAFATPLVDRGVCPVNVMDFILGVVCDQSTELDIEIGGRTYGSFRVKAGIPSTIPIGHPQSYPIVVVGYHEIRFIPKGTNGNVHVIGVRCHKDTHEQLIDAIQAFIIPNVCVFKAGLCYTTEQAKDAGIMIDNAITLSVLTP